MTFRESFSKMKLDLTKLVLITSGGYGGFSSEFEIKPKEFLRYAKEDLHMGTHRAAINSLSNAKRAIDCQIDEVFYSLGIDYQNLPSSLEALVSYYNFKDDLPYKLKVIQALNLAPVLIIAKSRSLRNKLEHFYKIPSLSEVREAIDIADLFIRSIDGKLKMPITEFYISDEANRIQDDHFGIKKGYNVELNFDSKKLNIHEIVQQKTAYEIQIDISSPEFYGFVRLMNSIDDDYELTESFRLIAHLIQHPIPSKHINVKQY